MSQEISLAVKYADPAELVVEDIDIPPAVDVDADGIVRAGNGTWTAAKALAWNALKGGMRYHTSHRIASLGMTWIPI